MYMEYYHYLMILAGAAWGAWVGWMFRGDCNKDKMTAIQMCHMREIFKTRKARLCDLMGLPIDADENHQPQK